MKKRTTGRKKKKKQEAAAEFPHPDVGGPVLPGEQRGHILLSPLSPLLSSPLFLLGLHSLPTLSLCQDNRGCGETMQKGKARGLCGGGGSGRRWGSEVLRRVNG